MDNLPEVQPLLDQNESKWKRIISVEPGMFFFGTAYSVSTTTLQNWLLQMNCENWDQLSNVCLTEIDAQVQSSQEYTFATTSSNIFSVITTIVAGTLTDRNLKYLKWFILLPILGHFSFDIINCLNAQIFKFSSLTTASYSAVMLGIGGGIISYMTNSTSYIAHTSTKSQRSVRMLYLLTILTLSSSTGILLGGYIVQYYGIFYSFLSSLVLGICGILSVSVFVKTKNFTYFKTEKKETFLQSMVKTLDVLKKPRPNNKRIVIIVLSVIYGITCTYPVAEPTILYLFLRKEFSWNSFTYGYYCFARSAIICLGSIFGAEVLKKKFNLSDLKIGLIGSIIELARALSWMAIKEEWQIYIAMVLALFEKSVTSVSFSLATKCVEPYEFGRLSSLYGSSNVLIPLAILLYNVLYQMTIYSFPQAVFLWTAFLCLVMIILFSYLLILAQKTQLFPSTVS